MRSGQEPKCGRAFGRYATQTSTALAVLLAAAGLQTAFAPSASAAPSCAEGPERVGGTIVGTPCDDTIHAPAGVASVRGGGGDDTIVASPVTSSAPCNETCKHLGVGSQTFEGGPGNDVIFGERGNDTLNGGGGDDSLYGGIGDDVLRGGSGNDLLSGGFGADSIDGGEGSDFVRGDATLDRIFDSGSVFDDDTLSYATGVTPGYFNHPGVSEYTGIPARDEGRGVYINMIENIADDGLAPDGGGIDGAEPGELTATDFETIVGSPFSDFIVGTSSRQTIYGGGGGDVILGGGGGDTVHGGADGDSCESESGGTIDCETSAKAVTSRDTSKVSVGIMAPAAPNPGVYLAGSNGADEVLATYATAPTPRVVFSLSGSNFDATSSEAGGCSVIGPTEAACPLPEVPQIEPPDALLLAGMNGNDTVHVDGFPDTTSIVELGGSGADSLTGGLINEDVLADGPGNDTLSSLGGDDALLNNEGVDQLDAGAGSDLLLSNSLCDGDTLYGGEGEYRDNASWTKLTEAVEARLDSGKAGEPAGEQPACPGGSLDSLTSIEDLEGSAHDDVFYGDQNANQLLGHLGADAYFALGGNDTILANSADSDLAIDCGEGEADTAFVDIPTTKYADPPPVDCENVYEGAPNDFQPPGTPLGPPPPSPAPPAPPAKSTRLDRRRPRTELLRGPAKVVYAKGRWRRVAFGFGSNESGSSFRCELDRHPFKPCISPRRYRLRLGRHAFRVFAIDSAGNRDRSPARFSFRIRRR
jgi:Ca2+-binding RTX toxin-like protein